jgi:hypothetical protein
MGTYLYMGGFAYCPWFETFLFKFLAEPLLPLATENSFHAKLASALAKVLFHAHAVVLTCG